MPIIPVLGSVWVIYCETVWAGGENTYTVGIILHLISAKDDERKGLE